jgi:hypothetical protein
MLMSPLNSSLIAVSLSLILGGCSTTTMTRRRASPASTELSYGSIKRILRDLDTSLWVAGTDLRPGLVDVAGKSVTIFAPHEPSELKGFGFANGSTTGNEKTKSLVIVLRKQRVKIPQRHCADLYNLHYADPACLRFGSCAGFDLVQILGSSGEKGYEVTYIMGGEYYLGRRVSYDDQNYDDIEGNPHRLSPSGD